MYNKCCVKVNKDFSIDYIYIYSYSIAPILETCLSKKIENNIRGLGKGVVPYLKKSADWLIGSGIGSVTLNH